MEQRRGATRDSLDFALDVYIKGHSAPRATLPEGHEDVACRHEVVLSAWPASGEQGPGFTRVAWWWRDCRPGDHWVMEWCSLVVPAPQGFRGPVAVSTAQLWLCHGDTQPPLPSLNRSDAALPKREPGPAPLPGAGRKGGARAPVCLLPQPPR